LAAGAAIVRAAGGTISALDGGPVNLNVGHIIASNGRVHAALQRLIANENDTETET
jgi:myo-inositol-1(or 4)-monophosphatase